MNASLSSLLQAGPQRSDNGRVAVYAYVFYFEMIPEGRAHR
jgi:hypothetical protein